MTNKVYVKLGNKEEKAASADFESENDGAKVITASRSSHVSVQVLS
jgi:hypothetical protein